MRLEVTCLEGLGRDLLLRLERSEIETVLLSLAHRAALMALPGIPRHRAATAAESQAVADAKLRLDDHLQRLGVVDASGTTMRRAVAISNRNLGTNHGNLAWQRSEQPRVFRIQGDPCDYPAYSCLTAWRDGRLSIEDLRFDLAADQVAEATSGRDVSDDVEWATFGQRVLRDGSVTRIEDILHEFSDIRHVLAFDPQRQEGQDARERIYREYPRGFRESAYRAWHDDGVPRARYVHNALGLSADGLVVVQREGTVEEIGEALRTAGAEDGIILDNGGSVVCWVWWTNLYTGGIVSPTVDYRPPGTSAIAFVLKGPLNVDLPGGSVSPTTY